MPYGLNQPFWSDGALKSRFIALPNDGRRNTPDEQVAFSAFGDWTYPTGTVFMKHFELPLDEADPRRPRASKLASSCLATISSGTA